MASRLLIDDHPLLVLPKLAEKIGLNEAIFLQQVHYWLNPKHNKNLIEGKHWVYNTCEQWAQQLPFWGEKTIRRIIKNLEEWGVLQTFVTKHINKVTYYTINYDNLNNIQDSLSEESMVLDQTMAESLAKNRSGQNDQMEIPKRAFRSGQSDHFQVDNLSTSIHKETETTATETTPLPPLSPHLAQNFVEKDEEEDKFNAMMVIWNETVQAKLGNGQDIRLIAQRKEALQTLIHEVLGRDLQAWKNLCTKISGSRFLMGQNQSGFKVTFDWAVKPANALKVLEDAIYDKPQGTAAYVAKPVEDVLEAIKSNVLGSGESLPEVSPEAVEAWVKVCRLLIEKLGQAAFTSWFGQAVCLEFTDAQVTIQLNTRFIRDYIEQHYRMDLERAIQAIRPEVQNVFCMIPNDLRG